jgi:sucrose-6-phosphate hydrolase SacC (GH32 family)
VTDLKWEKKGRIIYPGDNYKYIKSHAQIPTVLVLADRMRIYFATRPLAGISMTTFIDVEINNPCNIIYVHDKPILDLGNPGMFDEHGIMPNHVMRLSNEIYLYYVGWSRRKSVDYSNWIGLATSDDNGMTFSKKFLGPIVDRTPFETLSANGIFTMMHSGRWYMWYASGTNWKKIGNKWEHLYELRSGYSNDGINWSRNNERILENKIPDEANTRPSVIKIDDKWHMWFCYRGSDDFRDGKGAYRIGHACSNDLLHWNRDDEKAGIDVSPDGWDSTMIAYPYVVRAKEKIYMFYNGNGFGQSGFGFAELVK